MNDNDHVKVRLPGERVWAKKLHVGPPLIVEIVSKPVGGLHDYEQGDRLQVWKDDDGMWRPT
jgi:hypothetical protein